MGLILFLHCFLLSTSTLLLLDPVDELIDDRWPGRLLVPESHVLIRQRQLCKLQCLVPHVLVDTLLPRRDKEFRPPAKPWRIRTVPLDWGQIRTEQQFPISGGGLQCDGFLTRALCNNEGVLVDAREELLVVG